MAFPSDKFPLRQIKQTKDFFTEGLWVTDYSGRAWPKRALIFLVRTLMVIGKGYKEDKCSLQASALTYITMVSLVPMLAIMLAFCKGIGLQNRLMDAIGIEEIKEIDNSGEEEITFRIRQVAKATADCDSTGQEQVQTETQEAEPQAAPATDEQPDDASVEGDTAPPDSAEATEEEATAVPSVNKILDQAIATQSGLASSLPESVQKILVSIFSYVQKTNFAAMGIVGSLMVLISVIFSISKLEVTLNSIWGISKGRPFLRQFGEYLLLLILIPILFLIAFGASSLMSPEFLLRYIPWQSSYLATVLLLLARAISSLFVVGAFGLFYIYMPNTKVRLMPGMIAGLFASILWAAAQWAYISLQIGLARYNAIYGTFAIVPFFLGWMYASWSIILLGAEVSFALQNNRTLSLEKNADNASFGARIEVATLVLYEVCRQYQIGGGPWSFQSFARRTDLPVRVLRKVVDILENGKLLVRVSDQNGNRAEDFLPGCPPDVFTLDKIEEAFRQQYGLDARTFLNLLPSRLAALTSDAYNNFQKNLSSLTFKDIIDEENEK